MKNFLLKALKLVQELPEGGRIAIDLGEQPREVLRALGSLTTDLSLDGMAQDTAVYSARGGQLLVGARSAVREASPEERAFVASLVRSAAPAQEAGRGVN